MATTGPGVTDAIRLSVIIPVYNEERTIIPLLERIRAQSLPGVELEVIVVDDGSTDATGQRLAERPELYDRLIRRPRNEGKGAAVKDGLLSARGEFVLFQDADLEYDPSDYPALLQPVQAHGADAVIGSRELARHYVRVFYFWHRVGNRLLTLFFNILFGTTFTDVYSCYLLYRRDLVDPAALRARGWEQHAEILCQVVAASRSIYEVPIGYHGRSYAEGKKIRAHHALAVLWTILRGRLARNGSRRRAPIRRLTGSSPYNGRGR